MTLPYNAWPVDGFGPLTLADLELRADGAYAEHLATYTATTILHRALMALPDPDPDARALVDTATAFLKNYRDKTRATWHATRRDWATAAGIDLPDDIFDDPSDDPSDGAPAESEG